VPDRNATTGTLVEFVPEVGADASNAGALVEFVPESTADASNAGALVEFVPEVGAGSAAASVLVEFIPPIPQRQEPVIQGRGLRRSSAQGARMHQRGGKVIVGEPNFGD
jgi:hypothetical protein